MMTGRDVVIGRGVLIIGLVSVIVAIMIGYATLQAQRNDPCGEIGAQVIDVGGDGVAMRVKGVRLIRGRRPYPLAVFAGNDAVAVPLYVM